MFPLGAPGSLDITPPDPKPDRPAKPTPAQLRQTRRHAIRQAAARLLAAGEPPAINRQQLAADLTITREALNLLYPSDAELITDILAEFTHALVTAVCAAFDAAQPLGALARLEAIIRAWLDHLAAHSIQHRAFLATLPRLEEPHRSTITSKYQSAIDTLADALYPALTPPHPVREGRGKRSAGEGTPSPPASGGEGWGEVGTPAVTPPPLAPGPHCVERNGSPREGRGKRWAGEGTPSPPASGGEGWGEVGTPAVTPSHPAGGGWGERSIPPTLLTTATTLLNESWALSHRAVEPRSQTARRIAAILITIGTAKATAHWPGFGPPVGVGPRGQRAIPCRQARTQFHDLLDYVAEGGEVILSRRGKVVAKVVKTL